MQRLYHPPLPRLSSALQIVTDLPAFLASELEHNPAGAERASIDRYLRIWDALEERGLYDGTLLDIGCGNGFFSYLFAVTMCRQVTAVEDARAAAFGYSEQAFLGPLRAARDRDGLVHLEIVAAPVEQFLAEATGRRWDVVLCLSVLHHLYTGYGDDPEKGRLDAPRRRDLFRRIGQATGQVLYLEIDDGRAGPDFMDEFMDAAGFRNRRAIGSSCSAVGQTRDLVEIW